MGADHPPARFLSEAGLVVLPEEIRAREGRAWLAGWQGTRAVLRRLPVPAGLAAETADDASWLHGFMTRLAEGGFPSDIGALLGRYHAAVRQIRVASQRPAALPLAQVPPVLLSHPLDAIPAERAAVIRQLAAQLASDLAGTGHLARERMVIHGDFTNENVIASGTPPAASGVIDFALAHVETPLADIGYGLWRSGRPHELADHLDLSRIRQFLGGYASVAPISPDEASVTPLYLRGRGLQMIAKRVRTGSDGTGTLAQVQWLTANTAQVRAALVAALR